MTHRPNVTLSAASSQERHDGHLFTLKPHLRRVASPEPQTIPPGEEARALQGLLQAGAEDGAEA
eukprot:9289635-Alexandrium_andersonii.AAC.1